CINKRVLLSRRSSVSVTTSGVRDKRTLYSAFRSETEKCYQGLFGGGISPAAEHGRFSVRLKSLDRKYSTSVALLDQQKICSTLQRAKFWILKIQRKKKIRPFWKKKLIHSKNHKISRRPQRYEVAFPAGHPPVYDKYDVAESRLLSVTKRLVKENIYEVYDDVLRKWQKEGIIETIMVNEISKPGHYLPHRPVIKSSSLTTRFAHF
ncbi:uncharacterized protein CEXT_420341, partial [Caerostris extrusa]